MSQFTGLKPVSGRSSFTGGEKVVLPTSTASASTSSSSASKSVAVGLDSGGGKKVSGESEASDRKFRGRSILATADGTIGLAGAGGAEHTFSEEEKVAFSEHINQCMRGDPLVARHLPLNSADDDLFSRTFDGLLFCKLINLAVPDTIDERAINTKEMMNVYQKTENINLALNAAKSIGCQVVNIGAQDLIEGRPILILGLLWQIIRIQLLSHVSLKEHPELVVLLNDGETLAAFLKLPPETILMRWVNYHLAKAGSARRINNFTTDINDSVVYSTLLNQLNPAQCALCTETDPMGRAAHVIRNAQRIGVSTFLNPKDICDGNKKLNVTFVAQVFNTCPGLELNETERASYDLSTIEIEDAGDSREERVFRMWINSLDIEGVCINDLFADQEDGIVLLKVLDEVVPGAVTWGRRVALDPKNRIKKVENTNYAVEICKTLGLSMVNVGGIDITDGNKKLILAVMWQLMRKYTLGVLDNLAAKQGTAHVNEDMIVAWANAKVSVSASFCCVTASFVLARLVLTHLQFIFSKCIPGYFFRETTPLAQPQRHEQQQLSLFLVTGRSH